MAVGTLGGESTLARPRRLELVSLLGGASSSQSAEAGVPRGHPIGFAA